ncbi:hypothetical protein BC939DRAFT_34520 [Gamsiella multidivaricata]|uniref:uncharacterized protein n=1 Tax=Gamsiella multidivaricata TaxID=101098 RepID=UPI0022202CC0|nr:uncharacterized protein BC939DRAFT_34520 [Gamsiella multidivaricata]KAI7816668.1 hypothetical protein BC939DRAFT_34520 [Gamsiella multidivaricata]
MTDPPKRKSTSKSPPILPAEFLTPAPPNLSPRVSQSRNTSSDIGVLKLSGQVSQNDDRLPLPHTHQTQASGSESSGSRPNVSITDLPVLDDSPANYPPGHPYTQVVSSSSSSSSMSSSQTTTQYTQYHHESESQSTEILSVPVPASTIPENAPYVVEVSFSHSHNSTNSFSEHNTSGDSSGNRTSSSIGADTSGSMNSRSSDSQSSHISFYQADTSTPRHTPVRTQKSTPSDSDQSQHSPLAKITSQQQYKHRQTSLEIHSQDSGPSRSNHITTIPEHETIVIQDDPSQANEAFGTDPSLEEIEAAFGPETEEVHRSSQEAQVLSGSGVLEAEGIGVIRESLTSQDIPTATSSMPAPTKTKKRGDRKSASHPSSTSLDPGAPDYEYLTSDDDDASRSTLSNRLDLQLSESQVNISISARSRRLSSTSISGNQKDKPSSPPPTTTPAVSPPGNELTESVSAAADKRSAGSVLETQEIPSSVGSGSPFTSRTRRSTPPRSEGRTSTSSRQLRSPRSPHRGTSNSQDLPSSQASSSSDTFIRRLQSVASQDHNDDDHVFTAVPKRRRIKTIETEISTQHVVSSIGDEFWESSETVAATTTEHETRSRSGSQDISSFPEEDIASFPEDMPSEQDMENPLPLEPEISNESEQEDDPLSLTRRYQREAPSPPFKNYPQPRTSQTKEFRRRGSSQHSPPSTPTRRTTLRRLRSTTEAVRQYKVDDAVWGVWRKIYYAGVVTRKNTDKYEVRFLDDDISTCDASNMRPLKLRLGTKVMAMKTETMDYPAMVEGIHMTSDLQQSRVDVRFDHDKAEANLPLRCINLSEDMMAELDKDMDWDQEAARPSPQSRLFIPETSITLSRHSSSVSAPPGTPRKNRSREAAFERSTSMSATPSRRARGNSAQGGGPSTPSRRPKDIFKGLHFVLTFTKDAEPGLSRETESRIRAGGGVVLESFWSFFDTQRPPLSSLRLIAHKPVRTQKYLHSLALNVPRISAKWVETCSKDVSCTREPK